MESGGESSYHTAFEHDEYQPAFLKHLEPVTVVEGESATLECQVAGNPTVITWFKGDVAIRDSANYAYKKEAKNVYKLVIKVKNLNLKRIIENLLMLLTKPKKKIKNRKPIQKTAALISWSRRIILDRPLLHAS